LSARLRFWAFAIILNHFSHAPNFIIPHEGGKVKGI